MDHRRTRFMDGSHGKLSRKHGMIAFTSIVALVGMADREEIRAHDNLVAQ
jgi:hypothetical protein